MSHLLIDNLKLAIRERDAVLFVGAGVSIATVDPSQRRIASWTGLLENAVQRVEDLRISVPAGCKDRQLGAIRSGDMDEMLSAGEHVTVKLRRSGELRPWLNDTAGRFTVKEPSVLEAIRDLELPIVTTNYDGLLEAVTALPAVTWKNSARVESVLRKHEKAIVRIHGFFQDPDSVILGTRSYVAITQDEHTQTVMRSLRTLTILVFVGFGARAAASDAGRNPPKLHSYRSR